MSIRRGVVSSSLLAGVLACAPSSAVPPAEPTIARYADLLARGDAEALYAMLSAESKRAISKDELVKILKDQRHELREHAKAITGDDRAIEARARVRFADGEVVSLDVLDGRFRVATADALPAAARTPNQALGQLRKVLARRSYAGLLRVMSPKTRAAMERELRSLVEGLSEPEALQVEVVGDAASATIPGGHLVKLRREDGAWHIEDFD